MGWNLPELFKRLCNENNILNPDKYIYFCSNNIKDANKNDNELTIIYNAADVGITTSTGESFGLVPFEQSFLGVPQIIPNWGGIIESCRYGCIKVDTNDFYVYPVVLQAANGEARTVYYKDVANAMEKYYTDSDLYNRDCELVKKNIDGYSWDEIGEQLLDFLNSDKSDILNVKKSITKCIDRDIYQEEIIKLNLYNEIFLICLHKENELLSNSIRKYKIWEPNITDIWINILKDSNKDELVVDVGANIGYYSLLSAAFGFNCYSFEPEKENLKRFKSSIMLNLFYNKIKIFENIVYKESNIKLDLKRVPGKNKNNGCLSISNVFNKIDNIVDTGNNLSIKLDDVISNDKKICILKIDVEGAELDVIHGCMNILKNKQVKNFIIEISPKFLEIKYCKELATEICNYGYELFDIEQKKFISLDFFYNDINNIRQKDYIFKRIDKI